MFDSVADAHRGEHDRAEGLSIDDAAELKLLRAENAHLEQYSRLETLARDYLGLQPVKPNRETEPQDLPALASERRARP